MFSWSFSVYLHTHRSPSPPFSHSLVLAPTSCSRACLRHQAMAVRNNRGRQVVRHTPHPKVHYHRAGYVSKNHARQCPHVQKVISHHRITHKEAFLSILASGFSIVAALVSIGIVL